MAGRLTAEAVGDDEGPTTRGDLEQPRGVFVGALLVGSPRGEDRRLAAGEGDDSRRGHVLAVDHHRGVLGGGHQGPV